MADWPGAGTTAALSAAAARIGSELLGAEVLSSDLLTEGMMTFKCRVRTGRGDDLIVRFYPEGRAALVELEPDLLRRCHAVGLPVPQPIGDSRSGPPSPLHYMVYRRIEGTTLEANLAAGHPTRGPSLASELAQRLHELQRVRFQGSGELVSPTAARAVAWEVFVDESMRAGVEAIRKHALLDDAQAAAISAVVERGTPVRGSLRERLVWGDINFGNVLVTDSGRVAGLIDFEGCLSGDPLATLGYGFATHGTHPFFALVLQAWPQPLSEDDHDQIARYALLRALRLARYAHLPLPTGRRRDRLLDIVPGIVPALERLTQRL